MIKVGGLQTSRTYILHYYITLLHYIMTLHHYIALLHITLVSSVSLSESNNYLLHRQVFPKIFPIFLFFYLCSYELISSYLWLHNYRPTGYGLVESADVRACIFAILALCCPDPHKIVLVFTILTI